MHKIISVKYNEENNAGWYNKIMRGVEGVTWGRVLTVTYLAEAWMKRYHLWKHMGKEHPLQNHKQVQRPLNGNNLGIFNCRKQAFVSWTWRVERGGCSGKEEQHPDKMKGFCCKLLLFLVQAKLNWFGPYVSHKSWADLWSPFTSKIFCWNTSRGLFFGNSFTLTIAGI